MITLGAMREAARERIELLEAGLASFAARGFDATTMQAVADAARTPIDRALLHFPSKPALALAAYQALVAELQEIVAELPRGTVASRFERLVSAKLTLLDAQRPAMRALVASAIDAEGPLGVLGPSTAFVRARMSGAILTVVVAATDAPPDPVRLATTLYAAHLALVLLWSQDSDGRMARRALALATELLGSAGPLLAAPIVAAQLGRIEEVFGDRLSPVVTVDLERHARWVVNRLMDQRRLLPGRADGPLTEEELAPHLPLVRESLRHDEPISLLLPAFPAKAPNPRKVLGALPDMAERLALRSLQTLCEELGSAHAPGARMTLCSDGLVFADVVGVSDADVAAYGAEIDRLLTELPALTRFDLADAFGPVPPAEARRRLLAGWGETEEALLAEVAASPSLKAQLDGLHRFMFEDGVVAAPDVSRTQVRKAARANAVQVLLRSRAWGRLLAASFPRALRLSIHPQPAVSAKVGVHMLPTRDAWLTPWHGVALLASDRFELVHRADAEARGAVPVDVDGRPSHFVMPP